MAHLLSSFRKSVFLPQLTRSVVNRALLKPIPSPRDAIPGPVDFLKQIGRKADEKLEVASWEELWKLDGRALKKAEIPVRDRRYILWCFEKYRQGLAPQAFAHPVQPKKTVRGWGPTPQKRKQRRTRRA